MTDTSPLHHPSPGSPTLRLMPLGEPAAGHAGLVLSGGWARDADRLLLATAGTDRTVQVWQLTGDTLTPYAEIAETAIAGRVLSVGWARDGDRLLLATGSDYETVRVWQLVGDTLTPLGEPASGHSGGVLSVGWARDGDRLLLATSDGGTVRVWQLVGDTLTPLDEPGADRTGAVGSIGWARDGDRLLLAIGSDDGRVRVWQLVGDTLTPLGEPASGHSGRVLSVGWARDGDRLLLATSDGGTVRVWQLTGDTLTPLGEPASGHTDWVVSVGWARDGNRLLLATNGDGGTVRVWQLTGDTLTPLGEPASGHTDWMVSVGWAQDGDRLLLATGSYNGKARVWEVVEDRVVARLPFYRSDALGPVDELARTEEARALAELVTARSARPPLAVGLFGDWGEGKSHFLGLMQRQVEAVARAGNALAHEHVRQVRFNAWHYAETGLWASLVAELFTQLAAPGGDVDPGEAQRSMSRLTAELVAQRNLGQRLAATRERRDRLNRALRERALFSRLSADQQRQIADAVGGNAVPARLYRQAAGDGAVLRERLVMIRATVRDVGIVRIAGFLAACAAAAVAGAAAVQAWAWAWLPVWAGGLPGAVPLVAAATWIGNRIPGTRKKLGRAWAVARRVAGEQRARLETAAEVARAEVEALQRQMQDLTAAGQLAGLIDDRAATGDYRSQLGVMTQIREDFQRMAGLLARAATDPAVAEGPGARARTGSSGPSADEAGDDLPRIDRIIIYIDDLDRCPPARVVDMLEAIHLLLAVELFVVVVAIDPRWLLRSITAHYRDILDTPDDTPNGDRPDDAGLWRSTPAQYLEKIFQVVLTLPALDTTGYQRMLHTLVGVRADQEPPTRPEPTTTNLAPATTPPTGRRNAPAPEEGQLPYVPGVDAVRVVERTDPLTLDRDELALLDLLGPPRLITTPRGITRLANSYGLLTALRRAHRETDLAEIPGTTALDGTTAPPYRPYRAGMVLLAALIAHPALGPALCLHLHRQATDHPDRTWTAFCDTLKPHTNPDSVRRRDAVDLHIPPAEERQWKALHDGLRHVTQAAAARGLDLPAHLGAWREWVLPAARLSFPAGRIVNSLHQHADDERSDT